MNDLPEDVKQQLKAVTALAAKGIEKQQYVFDEEDDNVPSETLGLMQREEELTAGIGRSSSHNFLHLTLQEYLAAVHYSQQCDSPEQLTQLLTRDDLFPLGSFLQHYGKKRKQTIHWPAVLFLAGRTQLSGVPLDHLKAGLHDSSVDVSLLHLLYETQCPQLIQSTLVTSRKYISAHGRSALDWFVIGYCIANSTSTWRIEKKNNDVLKHFNHLVMGLKLAPQEGSGEDKIVSLDLSGSWSGNLKILLQLISFIKNVTNINLVSPKEDIKRHPVSTKGKLEEVLDCCSLLEELTVENPKEHYFPSSQFVFGHDLSILTLEGCKISGEATSSLIHSLLSPDYKLNKLSLFKCTISTTDHVYQRLSFTLQHTNDKVCLNATGSFSEINHWLLQLSSYTKLKLTETILKIKEQDSSSDETLENISLYHDVLEILKIEDWKSFVVPQFIGQEQNNLHTLSLFRCNLSSESTSSLIHSLQSPHCRLHKLALYWCTIPTTDCTLLTTAIVSSTTITHLFFIDEHIDTPSLTALVSGLKQNRTMEELAFDSLSRYFTIDEFQLLREGVDSSALKKLLLNSSYKNQLSDCPLSRDDVVIEWYDSSFDMNKKW